MQPSQNVVGYPGYPDRLQGEYFVFDTMFWLWVGFNLFVLAMLALDLGVFHRQAHAVALKEAAIRSVVWISLALLFNLLLFLFWERLVPNSAYGAGDAALAFLTGYLIEKALSVDNIFVFVMIFSYVIFALDSIPAIFAVTRDPFLIYTSNVFAILGLRSLYFVLAGVVHKFHYLRLGLAVVLAFVGVKMVLPDLTKLFLGASFAIPTTVSLGVVATVITLSIVASLIRDRRLEILNGSGAGADGAGSTDPHVAERIVVE